MSFDNSPKFERLKKLEIFEAENSLNLIFSDLINDLTAHLNIDLVNSIYKIYYVKDIERFDETNSRLYSFGVSRSIEKGEYVIKLFKNYKNFFPFFLLQSAYFLFIPDEQKDTKYVNYAINQFIEYDLQEFDFIEEWKSFVKEKYTNYEFRFDKFLELQDNKLSESPKHFFFEYIRRYPNLDFDDNLYFIFDKMYQEFLFKISNNMVNDEITETLRILIQIFYKLKNCDSLKAYFEFFKKLKNQRKIQTNLSFRSFRKNLRWINKFTYVTPTYYYSWKAMNIAVIPCYFKFNPLIDKKKIDLIIREIPFLLMPNLSIDNFSVELSSYFVIPRVYLKDLIKFMEKLENEGILTEKILSSTLSYTYSLNLNYFREFHKIGKMINLKNKDYSKDYECEFNHIYNDKFIKPNFDLLEFLILERLRFFSYYGVSLSRSREISNLIKSNYDNFRSKYEKIILELERSLEILLNSPDIQKDFANFLDRNQNLGFFYIKNELEKWKYYLELIESEENGSISSLFNFIEDYRKKTTLHSLENSQLFDRVDTNSYSFKNLYLDYYNSRMKYEKEAEKLRFYQKFISLCSELKIFQIHTIKEIISDTHILCQLIQSKKISFKNITSEFEKQVITNTTINQKIESFLNKEPQLINPYLIDSIWTESVSNYFPIMILKNSPEVKKYLKKIKLYLPKLYYYETIDLFDNQELIFLFLYLPYLNNKEKVTFISFLKRIFKENIIKFKRYPWNGLLRAFSRIDFYDFDKKFFFYSEDLFPQYFIYIKGVLGTQFPSINEKSNIQMNIWSMNKTILNLIQNVNKRVNSEESVIKLKDVQKLSHFHLNLEKYFLNKKEYENIKQEVFFKKFIKAIKVLPIFSNFGLSQYFLYINPFNFDDIDHKLLLSNTFQQVKYNASIGGSNSLFIKYIFPNDDPNKSYLNWLRGQYKLKEYCLFKIESMSQILHFNNNFSSNGWSLDSNSFKSYVQSIIFNPNYETQISEVKKFDIDIVGADYYTPDSKHYKSLLEIYNWHSIDIRKKIPFLNQSSFEKIHFLINNRIVYPYLKLKNLVFRERIYFFLINIKNNAITMLKTLFQYFNLVFIYEIKGEYYIHGFDDKKAIANGLLVKLYLPECELAEFLRIFEYIFQFLEVEKYIILTDLVNGDEFVKSIFGDNKIFETYNPLNNLIWDSKKKIWKNHKLFGPKFEYLYPDIDYNQEENMTSTLD